MIVIYPDSVLTKKASKITRLTAKVKQTIGQLTKYLTESDIGIGLAAPQVGVSLRILAIKNLACDCDHDHQDTPCSCPVRIFLNPEITDHFDQGKVYPQIVDQEGSREDFLEGCLSIPEVYGTVKRWLKIKVKYQLLEKNRLVGREETLENADAIVFQHELDHLNGVLFIDHIREDQGKLYLQGKKGPNKITFEQLDNKFKS